MERQEFQKSGNPSFFVVKSTDQNIPVESKCFYGKGKTYLGRNQTSMMEFFLTKLNKR